MGPTPLFILSNRLPGPWVGTAAVSYSAGALWPTEEVAIPASSTFEDRRYHDEDVEIRQKPLLEKGRRSMCAEKWLEQNIIEGI